MTWRAARTSGAVSAVFELTLILVWSLTVTSVLFHFGPADRGNGEYYAQIQNQFVWNQLKTCGACVFWNGNIDGGYPAFVDPFSAALHPTVVVSSLIFGSLHGATVALIAAFFLAGVAQWWLAKELGLGSVARIWSGAMAVVAGRLCSQLDNGAYVFVISTVAGALVLPPLLRVNRDARYRSSALLGIALGCFIVSGQGYLQIGFAVLSPLVLFLILDSKQPFWLIFRRLLLSVGIAGLLAAPFLVPLAHFWSSFAKNTDPTFGDTQPFRYIPLNLVIKDGDFFRIGSLGAPLYPYLSVNYIGWTAVILAVTGFGTLVFRHRWWLCCFFAGWIALAMWVASASPLRFARDHTTSMPTLWSFIVGIRNPAPIVGLALPLILGLSAIGVDCLWRRAPRYRLKLNFWRGKKGFALPLDPRWLLAAILMLAALDGRDFAKHWIYELPLPTDVPAVLDALEMPGAAWVNPPYGELYWTGQALERNMKLTGDYFKAWRLNGRESPPAEMLGVRGEVTDGTVVESVGDISIVRASPGNEYAAVIHDDGSRTPCLASSHGGNISVHCDSDQPGVLQILENNFDGWSATVNGADTPIAAVGQWMGVPVPAGSVDAKLRFRPWDVLVGFFLMIAGLILAAYCLCWADRRRGIARTSDRVRISIASSIGPHLWRVRCVDLDRNAGAGEGLFDPSPLRNTVMDRRVASHSPIIGRTK
jgi:hypothetical protein